MGLSTWSPSMMACWKTNVPDKPFAGPPPGLDSEAILDMTPECCIGDRDVLDPCLLIVLAQASNTDSMAGPTGHILDPQVGGTRANGDAVVSCADFRVENCDPFGELDMDAVSVGAISRRHHLHSLQLHIFAPVDHNMEHFTVGRPHSTDPHISRIQNPQCLQHGTPMIKV